MRATRYGCPFLEGGMMESTNAAGAASDALLDLAIEGWRIARLFSRVLTKLDAGDGARYANQVRYFVKRVEESLEAANLRLVNLEGQLYEAGFPATALNIGDFAPEDRLYVDQMLDPVIMGPQGVVKTGTVMLGKAG
jgi:hypothetical protein